MATPPSPPHTRTAHQQAGDAATAPPADDHTLDTPQHDSPSSPDPHAAHDTPDMPQSDTNTGDFRAENPPDRAFLAGDIVSEWREGRDKVVEIQRGPGEDVEVVVIKNAYGAKEKGSARPPFLARCSQAVHHAGQAVRGSVHDARPVRDAP